MLTKFLITMMINMITLVRTLLNGTAMGSRFRRVPSCCESAKESVLPNRAHARLVAREHGLQLIVYALVAGAGAALIVVVFILLSFDVLGPLPAWVTQIPGAALLGVGLAVAAIRGRRLARGHGLLTGGRA